MRQNILYCGKSYSFHRYCRQKIIRLIVFAVLAARGVRIFFFQFTSICLTAFQSLSAISVKNIASTAFFSVRSFKSNENIHKKEGGSYYVVSANKASSVTLHSPCNESQRKHTATLRTPNRQPTQRPTQTKTGSK